MENEVDISEYSYLWDGSELGWALFHFNVNQEDEAPKYGIVNIERKTILHIEDEFESIQIGKKMLKEGIQVVTKM
jgi:hypothetical protein